LKEAKTALERGKPEDLVALCRKLLPWTGQGEVDCKLGAMLRQLLRHDSPASIAEIERDVFTVERLATGWNPANASIAYVDWKYRHLLASRDMPDHSQFKMLLATINAIWPHLDAVARVDNRLYAMCATVHGVLGDVVSLQQLGEELLAMPSRNRNQEAALARTIVSLHRLGAVAEIEGLLGKLLNDGKACHALVEAALTAISALQSSAKTLADYKRLMPFLHRMVDLTHQGAVELISDPRLVKALIRSAAFDDLHRILPSLLACIEEPENKSMTLMVLEQLERHDVLDDSGRFVQQIYEKDPGDPKAAILLGRYLESQHVPSNDIEVVFDALRPTSPGYEDAVLWRAQLHYRSVKHAELLHWLELHPSVRHEGISLLLNRVHAAINRDPFPTNVAPGDADRLCIAEIGMLAPMLQPLAEILNGDLSHAGQFPLSELHVRLTDILAAVERAVAGANDMPVSDCLRTGMELRRAAATLEYIAGVHSVNPSADLLRRGLDLPQCGGPDHKRVCLLFETCHRLVMKVCRHAINAVFRGALLSDVRHVCRLISMHVLSEAALYASGESESLLHQLHAKGVARRLVVKLRERCALERGDVSRAAEWANEELPIPGRFYRLEAFDAWRDIERKHFRVLCDQKSRIGTFEFINPQGLFYAVPHEVPGTRIEMTCVSNLRIRDAELLIGSRGTIARPRHTHLRDLYGYPRRSPIRLNHGHGGCRLRESLSHLRVQEPAIVLANMDALYWQNYYHWMLLILTRVAALLEQGELQKHRLLLPIELLPWMKNSLSLVGLPADRVIPYTTAQEVTVDEAWIIGPVEYASAELMSSLRRRLWDVAGVDPVAAGSRAVWLSRREEPQRYLVDTRHLEELARRKGFEVINPGTLSLVDQVRLCASAKVIAGPEGSSFTNLMFARPGVQVLTLMVAGGDYETWLDMCIMGDLQQRWIFGRADPRTAWWASHHEPFEVDFDVVDRELDRLISTC
jgi:hypothetical protein